MQKTLKYELAVLIIAVIAIIPCVLVSRPNAPPNVPIHLVKGNSTSIANSINSFSFKFYTLLNNKSENQSSNLVFSPFSIFTVMSMMAEGAGGSTLSQMQNVLGISSNFSADNRDFGKLINNLSSNSLGVNLSIADAIWIEKTFPVNQQFAINLSKYYAALIQQADFVNNAAGETTNINNWVAGRTNNRILNLIPEGAIDENTRLVLVNAVYFKGTWLQEFNKSNTQNTTFFVSPSSNVTAPMMYSEFNTSYYSDNELQAIKLDYQGGNLSMLILLPNQKYGIQQVEAGLSSAQLADISSRSVKEDVQVWLPRFNMTTPSESIGAALRSLGIKSAFDPNTANFSGISSTPGTYISDVFHKAFIKVDEKGTEAAAATAGVMAGACMGCTEPPQIPQFRADHPFMFFIIDNHNGAILFMGKESNPTISG